MAKITPKMNLPHVLQEAANTCQTPAISMGCTWALQSLQRIAARAIEIKDEAILHELDFLGMITFKEVETPACEEQEPEHLFDIEYECPGCGHGWHEQYTATCDSTCPNCGMRNIQASSWTDAVKPED